MISVNDNCSPPEPILKKQKGKEASYPTFSQDADVRKSTRLTLGEFLEKNSENKLFSFFRDKDKRRNKNGGDEIIVAIIPGNGEREPLIQTGNYLGKFKYEGLDFDIRSRFGNSFLNRMLNFANDVYMDDIDVFGEKDASPPDFSRYILYYLFVQSLEKAYLLGLPKAYQNIQHHEMRLRGRLDINRHIKQDIPFTGKISSVSREQREIQEIVDVLHKTVMLIERAGKGMTKNIAHIKPHLREAKSGDFVSKQTITKAQSSKALLNPIFAPYKTVLRYAEYIIKLDSLQETANGKDKYFGFLVNVAELFEIYVTKLLQRGFPEWNVSSPKIELYDGMFYARKIIPDIVMQRGSDVLVFDTKYKRMGYRGSDQYGMGDVDRGDFFQINTYMSFYQQAGMNLVCGGLLYPLLGKHEKEKCHTDNWLGNYTVKFVIDGIQVGDSFLAGEEAFISRVEKMIDCFGK